MEHKNFSSSAELTDYFPLPRQLLELDLPSTAVLLYAVLLDRATLSQKNGYTDEVGWVYVIYTIEHLAQTLHVCTSVVKKHLKTLQDRGLIRRSRPKGNAASHIYLNIPGKSLKQPPADTKQAPDGDFFSPPTGKKPATNNRRKQQNLTSNYYQHREDESL